MSSGVAGNSCRAIRWSSCKSRSHSPCSPRPRSFIRGAGKAASVNTGLQPGASFLIETDASLAGYEPKRAQDLYRSLNERLAALPGVERASVSATVPFGMISLSKNVQRAGLQPAPDAKPATAAEGLAFNAAWNSVGADYFSTVGLPILRGRAFNRSRGDAIRRRGRGDH